MEKINITDFQKRKLNNFYDFWDVCKNRQKNPKNVLIKKIIYDILIMIFANDINAKIKKCNK